MYIKVICAALTTVWVAHGSFYESTGRVPDDRLFMHMHIGHGGGTFLCKLAKQNGEITYRSCNLRGDGAGSSYLVTNCSTREKNLALFRKQDGITFGACEHGFKEGEFCPHLYRYIIFIRNPMDTLNSYLSARVRQKQSVNEIINLIKISPHQTYNISDITNIKKSLYRLDNFVVRFLSLSSPTYFGPVGSLTQQDLANALEVLSRFELVITDEDMLNRSDMVAEMLHWKLGWTNITDPSSGHSTNSHGKHILTEDHLKYFRKRNELDMQLYERAKMMFMADYNRMKAVVMGT